MASLSPCQRKWRQMIARHSVLSLHSPSCAPLFLPVCNNPSPSPITPTPPACADVLSTETVLHKTLDLFRQPSPSRKLVILIALRWNYQMSSNALPVTAGFAIRNSHTTNILPQDQEGYDASETTDEKLSSRRIHWRSDPRSILIFWQVFFERIDHKTT